jgi:hypothetical protein
MSSVERRSHIRYDIQGEIFTGIIKNISHSGLCLYVLNPVTVGQQITIKSKHELYRKGTIMWLSETGEKFDIYKVGLKFV